MLYIYIFLFPFVVLYHTLTSSMQAFKAIRGFLDKLEKLSEDPDLLEEMGEYHDHACICSFSCAAD